MTSCRRLDIIAAGRPDAIQIYRQTESGEFEMLRRNRIRGLSVSRDGMIVEDLIGTDGPLGLNRIAELLTNARPSDARWAFVEACEGPIEGPPD